MSHRGVQSQRNGVHYGVPSAQQQRREGPTVQREEYMERSLVRTTSYGAGGGSDLNRSEEPGEATSTRELEWDRRLRTCGQSRDIIEQIRLARDLSPFEFAGGSVMRKCWSCRRMSHPLAMKCVWCDKVLGAEEHTPVPVTFTATTHSGQSTGVSRQHSQVELCDKYTGHTRLMSYDM